MQDPRLAVPIAPELADCWHGGAHAWADTTRRAGRLVEEQCSRCGLTRWVAPPDAQEPAG